MTRRDRLVVEILVPAPLGTALLILWNLPRFIRPGFEPETWVIYLLFGYVFAIGPSCIYALLVEVSLRRRWWRRLGAPGFVGFSTGLGTLAGVAIWRVSEARVVGIGAVVGLLLGILLAGAVSPSPGRAATPSRA